MSSKSILALLLLIAISLAACGGDEKDVGVQGAGSNSSAASNSNSNDNNETANESSSIPLRTSIINASNADQLVEQASTGRGTLNSFYWSPDNESLAAVTSTDIRLYHVDDLSTPTHVFDTYTGYVEFSPDGATAISPTIDNETVVWDVATGETQLTLSEDTLIVTPKFSPDGQQIAGIQDGAVQIWDTDDGQLVDSIDFPSDNVYTLFYRDDGALLSVVANTDTLEIWDVRQNDPIFDIPINGDYPFFGIQVSADGHIIAVPLPTEARQQGSFFINAIDIRDTRSGQQINLIDDQSANISQDGNTYLVYDFLNGLVIKDIRSDEEIGTIGVAPTSNAGQFFGLYNLKTTLDNRLIGAMDYSGNLMIFSPLSGDQIGTISDFGSRVTSLDIHPNGRSLMLGSTSQGFTFLNIANGEVIDTATFGTATNAYYLSNGEQVVAFGGDMSIWDIASEHRERLILASQSGPNVLSPDNKLVAMIDADYSRPSEPDFYLRVMDIEADRFTFPEALMPTGTTISHLAFSPDSRSVAVALNDGTLLVYNATSGDIEHRLDLSDEMGTELSFAYHPDGSAILVSITPTLNVRSLSQVSSQLYYWDLENDQAELITAFDTFISTLAYSPDGSILVLGGLFETGGMLILDGETFDPVTELGTQRQSAYELSFSYDGRVLVSVGNDNLVRVWGLAE